MLVPFDESRYEELKRWWRIGVDFVEAPTDAWCRYVCDDDKAQCLCSIDDGRITAYSQTDIEGQIGCIAVVAWGDGKFVVWGGEGYGSTPNSGGIFTP